MTKGFLTEGACVAAGSLRSRLFLYFSAVVFPLLLCGFPVSGADSVAPAAGATPSASSQLLSPGKVDLFIRSQDSLGQYNLFGWTPSFKGGAGIVVSDAAGDTYYGGGYVRPLTLVPERGDLIIGGQANATDAFVDYEVQAEYRFPFGLGFGGGILERGGPGNDIQFGKVTFRNQWKGWSYILEMQGQAVAGEVSPGGYLAIYNDWVMAVYGNDGEQWRGTFALTAPTNKTIFRPVGEVLYVDETIGDFDGARRVFANATLGYKGGFLSNGSRLGRAMGPQGIEFANPLGFLALTWNRRLEAWEMGGLADFRYEQVWFPGPGYLQRFEADVFPFQFFSSDPGLTGVFLGATHTRTPAKNTPGIIAGFMAKIGFLNPSIAVEHEFDPTLNTVLFGFIARF
jgi:hypothetical protein